MAAVLTTKYVADTISKGEAGVLMHGPTFMGNPLSCAIAAESIDILNENDMGAIVGHIEKIMTEEFIAAQNFENIADIRVLGSIGVIEMKRPVDVGVFQKKCVENGVWIRPFGTNVYIMPPYVISDDQLRTLCRKMLKIISDEKNY